MVGRPEPADNFAPYRVSLPSRRIPTLAHSSTGVAARAHESVLGGETACSNERLRDFIHHLSGCRQVASLAPVTARLPRPAAWLTAIGTFCVCCDSGHYRHRKSSRSFRHFVDTLLSRAVTSVTVRSSVHGGHGGRIATRPRCVSAVTAATSVVSHGSHGDHVGNGGLVDHGGHGGRVARPLRSRRSRLVSTVTAAVTTITAITTITAVTAVTVITAVTAVTTVTAVTANTEVTAPS